MKTLDLLVLHAVKELGSNAYGVPILARVEELRPPAKGWQFWRQDVCIGALYIAFDRLEERGYLGSYQMPGDATRGGRDKRHFYLTRDGEAALSCFPILSHSPQIAP